MRVVPLKQTTRVLSVWCCDVPIPAARAAPAAPSLPGLQESSGQDVGNKDQTSTFDSYFIRKSFAQHPK